MEISLVPPYLLALRIKDQLPQSRVNKFPSLDAHVNALQSQLKRDTTSPLINEEHSLDAIVNVPVTTDVPVVSFAPI